MFRFDNRVVAITGASSGLGAQMADAFAQQGASLVLMARRVEKCEALAKILKEKYNAESLCIKCDVTSTESVNAAAKSAEEKFGNVDILINNAGASKNGGCLDMTDEDWDFTIDVDLKSVFLVTRAFGNIMKKNNYGRIINIASIYGLVGNKILEAPTYHASKGGVINFTRAVAAELAKYNITCNAICPGFFTTELTESFMETELFDNYCKASVPMLRWGKEGEINPGAIFLASEEASYVTGIALPIDGGYTAV
ncbi:Glucose/ribitol dehydrogenase [Carpediemonas membranifera]|uniref:Glucose/ribitol dehydrogenase n=1 Tax=Carpediemonas membranifera TaxID=201153 RepID=A0A8J6B1F6_9EUKA|nr:Glucose/ribitol dehydrogenase [Carpediemonas membranifera]|eukprot:KAG9392239.1 Glucose/ribitol dehydrogenase [Carpediemonas membranifera]